MTNVHTAVQKKKNPHEKSRRIGEVPAEFRTGPLL